MVTDTTPYDFMGDYIDFFSLCRPQRHGPIPNSKERTLDWRQSIDNAWYRIYSFILGLPGIHICIFAVNVNCLLHPLFDPTDYGSYHDAKN